MDHVKKYLKKKKEISKQKSNMDYLDLASASYFQEETWVGPTLLSRPTPLPSSLSLTLT